LNLKAISAGQQLWQQQAYAYCRGPFSYGVIAEGEDEMIYEGLKCNKKCEEKRALHKKISDLAVDVASGQMNNGL